MPGGRTHATISRSFSHAAVRLPRFELTAWCSGVSTWNDDEHDPDERQRTGQRVAPIDGADQRPGRDREQRGQHAPQEQHHPPQGRQRARRTEERREEPPLLARS